MKTWNDYKDHVKATDPESAKDIEAAESMAAIVAALIEQRNVLGVTQRELASICGMPQSSVARIESFKTIPNLDTLLKLCRPLGLTVTVVPQKPVA